MKTVTVNCDKCGMLCPEGGWDLREYTIMNDEEDNQVTLRRSAFIDLCPPCQFETYEVELMKAYDDVHQKKKAVIF